MQYSFNVLLTTRKNILELISSVETEFLFQIPEGFNNHLMWNVAHCVVTQQLLCYGRSGLPFTIPDKMIEKYRKGSVAESGIQAEEADFWKSQLIESARRLQKDFKEGIFASYDTYTTSYNVTLRSIKEAILFNNVHEGVHYGYMLAMQKQI